MFNLDDAKSIADKLNITFDKFSIDDFLTGLNIELEHGTINPNTDVTSDNLETTAKITLVHLLEFPNYYNSVYGLPVFEQMLYDMKEKE